MDFFNISLLKPLTSLPDFSLKKGVMVVTKDAWKRISTIKKENEVLYKTALVIGGLLVSTGCVWMAIKEFNNGIENPINIEKPQPSIQTLPDPFEVGHNLTSPPRINFSVSPFDVDQCGLAYNVSSVMYPILEAKLEVIGGQSRYLNLTQSFRQHKKEPVFANNSFISSESCEIPKKNYNLTTIQPDFAQNAKGNPETTPNSYFPWEMKGAVVALIVGCVAATAKVFSKTKSPNIFDDNGRYANTMSCNTNSPSISENNESPKVCSNTNPSSISGKDKSPKEKVSAKLNSPIISGKDKSPKEKVSSKPNSLNSSNGQKVLSKPNSPEVVRPEDLLAKIISVGNEISRFEQTLISQKNLIHKIANHAESRM